MASIGKLIVGTGVALVILGLCLWLFADKLGWLGNLPGDFKVERPGFSLYFPVTTMLLLSFGLSGILWLVGRISR